MSKESGREHLFGRKTEFFIKRFPLNYKFIGAENIQRARDLLAQGITIVAEIDHKTFADLISGTMVVVKEEFDDLVREANIVAKITYLEKFPSKQVLKNFKVRPVVPHTMPDYPKREEINRESVEWAQSLPRGSILITAPEGTRVKKGSMEKGRWGASEFWHGNGERWILPVAIEGTEKQYPRGFWGLPKYLFGGFRIRSVFIIGQPVPVANLDKVAEMYAGGIDNEEFARLKTDLAMLLIANLHQDPEYKGTYYVQLKEDLDAHEISQNLRNLENIFSPK